MICVHGTKLHMLGHKLHSETSKTKQLIPVHLDVPLFWKSHCATCVPACVILCSVTRSCKRAYSLVFWTQNHFSWSCFSVIYYQLFQTPAILDYFWFPESLKWQVSTVCTENLKRLWFKFLFYFTSILVSYNGLNLACKNKIDAGKH